MGTQTYDEALKPAGVLKPGWLSSREVVQFIHALRTAGIGVAFTGGAVRDALRDPFVHPKDYDVFADAPAKVIHEALIAQGVNSHLHKEQNQVYVRIDDAMFDLFRLPENEADRHHWLSPESLRDKVLNFEFTINTPVLRPDGTLYDFFGATSDIQENRVRFLIDPMQVLDRHIGSRFVMRYFRFCAQFGAEIEDHSVAACKKNRGMFSSTDLMTKYYIRKDACTLMARPYIAEMLSLLQDQEFLQDVYGVSSLSTAPLQHLIGLENGSVSPEHLLRRLAAMLLGCSNPLEALTAMAKQLQLDDADAPMHKKLRALLSLLPQVDTADRNKRRALVKTLRRETLETLLLLRSAAESDETAAKELYLSLAQSFSREGYVPPHLAAQYVAVRGGAAPYSMDQHYGFTLVEMSVVLVIIGLIVGSIVVGKDLIHASEVRAAISQIAKYNGEVNTFRTKYSCLPGDCALAQAQVYTLTSTDLTGQCGQYPGDGNGIIGESSVNTYHCGTDEQFLFWKHLQDAQLFGDAVTGISSDSSGLFNSALLKFAAVSPTSGLQAGFTILPGDKTDGTGLTQSGKGFGGTHLFWITSVYGQSVSGKGGAAVLKPLDASIIDQKVDDGNPLTGTVLAVGDTVTSGAPTTPSEGIASAHDCVNTSTTPASYNTGATVASATSLCGLIIQSSF